MDISRFFAAKLYGIRKVLNSIGDTLPERASIRFIGFAVSDDDSGKTTNVELSALTPLQHGNLPGGALHSNASGVSSGFMSAADKTKLDAATSVNTATTLVLRDAGGGAAFTQVTADTLESASAVLALSANGTTVATLLDDPPTMTVVGTSKAKSFVLTEAVNVVRFVRLTPSADPAHWSEDGAARWSNLLASSAAKLIVRLDVPNGAIITRASVRIDPPAHGIAPAVLPVLSLYRWSEFSSSGTLVATASDPGTGYTSPDTTYDAAHTFHMAVGFGGEIVDNSAARYFLELIPENGANSFAATLFLWARIEYTVPVGTVLGLE